MKNENPCCPFFEVCFVPATLQGTGVAALGKYCRENFACCAYYRRLCRAAERLAAVGEEA